MDTRKRREYADKLGKFAVYSFSKSIGSRFEGTYLQIGEDYLGLLIKVEENASDLVHIGTRARELSDLLNSLKEKEGRK